MRETIIAKTDFTLLGHRGRCFDSRIYRHENTAKKVALRAAETAVSALIFDENITDDEKSTQTTNVATAAALQAIHGPGGQFLLTASEDGTARLWDLSRRVAVVVFPHSVRPNNSTTNLFAGTGSTAEVLRATAISEDLVVTAGSDGEVWVWKWRGASAYGEQNFNSDTPVKVARLPHRDSESQVYVCEPRSPLLAEYATTGNESGFDAFSVNFSRSPYLITAADNELHLWDLSVVHALTENVSTQDISTITESQPARSWVFEAILDDEGASPQPFGGDQRNPNGEVFIFDAKWSPAHPNIIAVALSDGTIRIIDITDSNLASATRLVLSIELDDSTGTPEPPIGHATGLAWNGTADVLTVSFGGGYVAILDVRRGEAAGILHLHGSPCYGTQFLSSTGIVASWGSDSSLRLWNVRDGLLKGATEALLYSAVVRDLSLLAVVFNPFDRHFYCVGSTPTENSFLGTPIISINPFSPPQDS